MTTKYSQKGCDVILSAPCHYSLGYADEAAGGRRVKRRPSFVVSSVHVSSMLH